MNLQTIPARLEALAARALTRRTVCGAGLAGLIASAHSAPASATHDPPLSADIYDAAGAFSPAAYRAIAATLGAAEGIAYRYGPAPGDYDTDSEARPTLHKNPDHSLDVISDQAVGRGKKARPCFLGHCGTWQLGGPPHLDGGGSYSSNQGQVVYVADDPAQRIGVTDLTTLEVGSNVVTIRPQLPWTYYGGGLDSVNQVAYKKQGKDTRNPVAVANGEGRPGNNSSAVVAYQSGFLGVSGHNTSSNKAGAQLADGLVPTSVAVTNGSEFALVSCWDTANLVGKVAVVALAGSCQGGYLENYPGGWSSYRGEWDGIFPGMPNLGNISFMKVLGYVELPGMKAPTEITATTNWSWQDYSTMTGPFSLKEARTRALFRVGGPRSNMYPRGGVAIVASKSEKKVCFIDLKPLFAHFRAVSFGSAAYPAVGYGANQWPYTFEVQARQRPTVIKTVSFASRPTAVKAYPFKETRRVWIATQDGVLHTWDLGDYPTDRVADPASIREVGTVRVGRNPTGIACVKQRINVDHILRTDSSVVYPHIQREIIVTSRGDRKVEWVRFDGGYRTGKVVRTLRDSRLVDPIRSEDSDNHTSENYILSVCDYAGRQLANYRYGPAIFWWYRGRMTDGDSDLTFDWSACRPPGGQPVTPTVWRGQRLDIEFGGAFALPGKAFQHVSANVY